MPEILTFNTEAEWLAARRKYVTSTEVSALFGQNSRLTAYELACIKKDPTLDTFEATERTEWGQDLQQAVGDHVASKYGLTLESLDWQLAVRGSCAASGDFMVVHAHSSTHPLSQKWWHIGGGMLEIKNVDSLIFKQQWSETDMPDHIEIQLQAEMLCWGTHWGAVAVLVGGNRLELYIRERDEKVCELIAVKSKEFMENLAKGITPPPIMPQDAEMVIALNQYAEPNKVYDVKETGAYVLETMCKAYKSAKKEAQAAESVAETFKAKIFELIGNAERAVNIPGYNLSAAMRAPVEVAAHTRAGFRDLRITERKKSGT